MIKNRRKKLCNAFILLICLFTLLVSGMAISNKYEGKKELETINVSGQSEEIAFDKNKCKNQVVTINIIVGNQIDVREYIKNYCDIQIDVSGWEIVENKNVISYNQKDIKFNKFPVTGINNGVARIKFTYLGGKVTAAIRVSDNKGSSSGDNSSSNGKSDNNNNNNNPSTVNKKCVTLNGNNSNKLAASCENTSGNGCINGECCDVSKGNCRITVTSKEPSNYSVGTTPNCTYGVGSKTRYFNFNSNSKDINVYACNNTNIGSGNNGNNKNTIGKRGCKISVVNAKNASVKIYDAGDEVKNSDIDNDLNYECQTNECFITVSSYDNSRDFNGIAGDGDCSTGGRYDTKTSNKLYCYDDITAKACYLDECPTCVGGSSSGGSGGSSGGGNVVDEPTSDDEKVKINSFFYAKGKENSGDAIACGDKLFIKTCTTGDNAICDVTSINENNVKTSTQIYKRDIVQNESETGCYQKIERYIAEKTYYYSDKGLSKDKTEISCGSIVTFKKEIKSSCDGKSCEVEYNGKTVYINIDYITSDKPACQNQDSNGDGSKTCVTSKNVTGAKGEVPVSICKKDDTEDTRNKIVSCAEDYEFKYKLTNDTCKDSNSDNCYKDYLYTCSYIKRPGVNASAGAITTGGKGTINITGVPYGDIPILGYHVSSGEEPTVNSNWSTFNAVNNSFSIERTAGTYFIWAINNKRRISYPVLAKVYDADLSTTLASFKVQDGNGNDINTNISSLDGTVGYKTGVKDSKYALLSNDLIADSVGGFDKLTTSYELSVTANKIALYATLTSSDATYVSGYEPRTIDLDYGRNVALIKIVNKEGKERCYTFIINRVDDRNNSNLLKNVKLSRGSIDFDPYTTNYDVKISRFTKKVSVNAELDSSTSKFIKGYEPREVEITEDRQSVVLKVISEAGSIRSYVITFIRNGEDKDNINSTYLSSLTVPGTMLGFDKETYDYTITVPYETEDLPIYAFAEDENATVNVGNNTGLKVGNNLIQIEVKNNNKTRIYSLHVIRKESGLDISNSARLGTLSIKNYNIEFSPDKLDYEVKIKREKTLLISATPESNRADIYMYGNNDLTGFSTIRVKVIAENGLTNIYSIDIQKAAYNKKIEIIASVAGVSALLIVSLVIYLKKKNNKKKEYLEG